jgi:hypothetical protein
LLAAALGAKRATAHVQSRATALRSFAQPSPVIVFALYTPNADALRLDANCARPEAQEDTSRLSQLDRHRALRSLTSQAQLAAPSILSTCLALEAGPIRPRRDTPAPPQSRIWIAPSGRRLTASEVGELEAAIRGFLAEQGRLDAPAVVEIDVPAAHAPAPDAALQVLHYQDLERVAGGGPLESLGEIFADGAGQRWLVQYGTNDDSHNRLLAADLCRQAGVAVPTMLPVKGLLNAVHTALHLPAALQPGMQALTDAGSRRSFLKGIAVDAWLRLNGARLQPAASVGVLHGEAYRLNFLGALGKFGLRGGPPERLESAGLDTAVHELDYLLYAAPGDHPTLHRMLSEEISLQDLADGIRKVLRVDNGAIEAAAARYPLCDPMAQGRRQAVLAARRDFLGSLTFLGRIGRSFYEPGAAPADTRGPAVRRLTLDAIDELVRPPPRALTAPAAHGTSTRLQRSAHHPDERLAQTVRQLLRDPDYLAHPVASGGERHVYPIPGTPYLFKLNHCCAGHLVRWRAYVGVDDTPEWVVQRARQHVARQNIRHAELVHAFSDQGIEPHPELSIVVDDVPVPTRLISGLGAAEPKDAVLRLPVLGSIQRIFPNAGNPDALSFTVPYAEYGVEPLPEDHRYHEALQRWVLNVPVLGGSDPWELFRHLHPASTAIDLLLPCRDDDELTQLAQRFFSTLIQRYCPATGQPIDFVGKGNDCWYRAADGRIKLALLDSLFPVDVPILRRAEPAMRRWLAGSPLPSYQRLNLLNAINFAGGVNFMASNLQLRDRIDLFPDAVLKQRIAQHSTPLLVFLSASQPTAARHPNPDKPWGRF